MDRHQEPDVEATCPTCGVLYMVSKPMVEVTGPAEKVGGDGRLAEASIAPVREYTIEDLGEVMLPCPGLPGRPCTGEIPITL